jgi:DNA topoisomerase-1
MPNKTLVIVESPTKAKTIRNFLPKGYTVHACMGHIRDLPESAAEIPEKVKKEAWARLGVDVDNDFEPLYVVSRDRTKVVRELKEELKDADDLLLATDEDREGESISWHLLEVLRPELKKRNIPFRRLVFHEITKDAIKRALEHTRELDENLVKAQETRRILDRLVGYGLSPLLWKKIAFGLSAGRVQSVAMDLVVKRERERMAFKKATYWDLSSVLGKGSEKFDARLWQLAGKSLASGKDFDEKTGALKAGADVRLLDEAAARALADRLRGATFTVQSVEEKPVVRRPPPPLITSTLQQEANRKLGMGAKETMRVAQSLYERGLITYMRTDSVHLSEEAVKAARGCVEERFGKDFVADGVRVYKTSTKGAQEAHEAIRPSTDFTAPRDTGLSGRDYEVYELIWMRTLATQMADAQQTQIAVRIAADDSVWSASGMRITFPGWLRAYVEGSDDPAAALEDREKILPAMAPGDVLAPHELTAETHETKPLARYTEASLIQFMEKEGIGRPSTFATIVGTIIDRGYVIKSGNQLVPTFTAFVVSDLLESQFPDLVDVKFTSQMEESLDAIADGTVEAKPWLAKFFLGDGGLRARIDSELGRKITNEEARQSRRVNIPSLEGVAQVFVGKFGPYVEMAAAEGETLRKASLPAEVVPSDLSPDRMTEILERYQKSELPLGSDPATGKAVYLKSGTYGPYVQLGDEEEAPPEAPAPVAAGQQGKKTKKAAKAKAPKPVRPKRVSLPKNVEPKDVTLELALKVLELPRLLGVHPETAKEIRAGLGRFGPYVVSDGDFRSLKKEDDVLTVGLDRALELLAQPKGRGRGQAAPLRTVGAHPADGLPIFLYEGKYGFYVKHGERNATVGKAELDPATVTLEQAVTALAEAPPPKRKPGQRTAAPRAAAKKAAPKKAPAAKAAANGVATRKAAAPKRPAATASK